MKEFISILFYVLIGIIPIGMIFRIQHSLVGNIILVLGLMGLFTYFTARTIRDIVLKRIDRYNILLQILIVLMSIILVSKYLYHFFGDYPGLLIIPLFIVISSFYLIKVKTKYNKLTITTITYLLLSIPLFGLDFHKAPRQYIPQDWYNRYDVEKAIPITLSYGFQFKETEELSVKAFEMRKINNFHSAILLYHQALKLEPQNPFLFFDISECYARINDLETAIAVLDTAILIDSSYAVFFNNRGLLYYKLKANNIAINDFRKAIQIDSTKFIYYANLALAFYYNDLFKESCEAIEQAENLGLTIDDSKELKRIKKERCK
jgi:tetratricopeptide (TPR) repeat protein